MEKHPIIVSLLFISAVGTLLTVQFAYRAATWHAAENYASLVLAFLGPAIALIQLLLVVPIIFWTRDFKRRTKVAMRCVACCLLAVTVIATLWAWD